MRRDIAAGRAGVGFDRWRRAPLAVRGAEGAEDVPRDVLARFVHATLPAADSLLMFKRSMAKQTGLNAFLCTALCIGDRRPGRRGGEGAGDGRDDSEGGDGGGGD